MKIKEDKSVLKRERDKEKKRTNMGTSGAVELELERRESLGGGGLSSTSQLGTHWLMAEVCSWWLCVCVVYSHGKKRLIVVVFMRGVMKRSLWIWFHYGKRENLVHMYWSENVGVVSSALSFQRFDFANFGFSIILFNYKYRLLPHDLS